MQALPNTFFREDENYITMLPLKRLAKSGLIPDLRTTMHRDNICNRILTFSKMSKENDEIVASWIDSVIKEGIKDVYIQKLEYNSSILLNDEAVVEILENSIDSTLKRHMCGNHYTNESKLVKYEINNDPVYGKIISLLFCRMIHWYSKDKGAYGDWFPVSIDIYADYGYITGRVKPKSMIFNFMQDGFDIEAAKSITSKGEVFRVIDYTLSLLGIHTVAKDDAEEDFKSKLYKILNKYTYTPIEIQNKLNAKRKIIEQISNIFREKVCEITQGYEEDIFRDLINMSEKYMSISYSDKEIFIRKREAYPLVVEATDEEDSHVEQTAGFEEPLQSKAIFFDNKRMMQKSGWCDCIKMCYARKNDLYASNNFKVKAVVKRDHCFVKFNEFTLEEDIKHVLFSIISA